MANAIKIKLIAFFIALSMCVTYFWFTRSEASGNTQNSFSMWIFVADSHIHGHYDQMTEVWQARIGGNWLTARLADAFAKNGALSYAVYRNLFASYNTAWVLLTFIALIIFIENPAFIIALVFAGLCYSLTPPDDVIITPWDLPSMFFWTLSFLLWQRKNYLWMLAVLVLGTAFKETVAVTAFLFFFTTLPWRKRWIFFGAAFVACVLLKLWITYAVMGQCKILTADVSPKLGFRVFQDLVTPHLNHFIWINAGTLVVALCLPMRNLVDQGTKFILSVFLIGLTAACILANTPFEFRQLADVLPISVLYLDRIVQGWLTPKKESDTIPQPNP